MTAQAQTTASPTLAAHAAPVPWSLGAVGLVSLIVIVVAPVVATGWVSMFINIGAIFLTLKHWVWVTAAGATRDASGIERIAYYTLWPGFDVDAFLDNRNVCRPAPALGDWLAALVKTALAAAILWMFVPQLRGQNPLLIGAAGMLSGVLFIHCGLFHLIALGWQTAGRPVAPIMNQPLAADSLDDFWGRRWNLAFRDAVALVLFRPLARRFSTALATQATFLLSGLWHEALLSLPARGGYGLPTLYFVLQGLAMSMQRRWLRPRSGPLHSVAGRVTTALVVVLPLPLPLLFHRPFAERVMIPFLQAIGAL